MIRKKRLCKSTEAELNIHGQRERERENSTKILHSNM
jgi:hypothetical protein